MPRPVQSNRCCPFCVGLKMCAAELFKVFSRLNYQILIIKFFSKGNSLAVRIKLRINRINGGCSTTSCTRGPQRRSGTSRKRLGNTHGCKKTLCGVTPLLAQRLVVPPLSAKSAKACDITRAIPSARFQTRAASRRGRRGDESTSLFITTTTLSSTATARSPD